jgi:hypothetical protein
MHLRQRRGNIQNIIIVFPDNEASIASLYLPIQVDKAYAAEIIRTEYPNACRTIIIPSTFSSVIGALCKKSIQCSLCYTVILEHLAFLCDKHYIELKQEFPAEEEVNFYCINLILHRYISIALDQLDKNRADIELLRTQAFQIKDAYKVKRQQRLKHESYLGSMEFDNDLRRSCVEFYLELKKKWKFTPVKCFYMS